MGKNSKFFGALKKLFSNSDPQEKKQKNKHKKKWLFGKARSNVAAASRAVEETNSKPAAATLADEIKEIKLVGFDGGPNKHAYSVALASAVAAEAAAVAAQAAAEVVRLTAGNGSMRAPGKSKEELAVIKIQTAFRGYLARRALRALRGLVRLKKLVDGSTVGRQTAKTLRAMRTLARVQLEIHSRRVTTEEDKKALQKQLQQKREQELQSSKIAEDWDLSHKSKEEIEASLQMKHEAAVRRERSLAYAFSHQWRSSSARTVTPAFADPNNPEWGWSWLERWTAHRPRDVSAPNDKEIVDRASSARSSSLRLGTPQPPSRPHSRQSPATPSKVPSATSRVRPTSPRRTLVVRDDEARSITSIRSDMPRLQSIAGSSFRDDVSLTSTPPLPSYMQPTESTRAKERLRSPSMGKAGTPERWPASSSARKRLSFPIAENAALVATVSRRYSEPPKLDEP